MNKYAVLLVLTNLVHLNESKTLILKSRMLLFFDESAVVSKYIQMPNTLLHIFIYFFYYFFLYVSYKHNVLELEWHLQMTADVETEVNRRFMLFSLYNWQYKKIK